MYRPDNWKNPHKGINNTPWVNQYEANAYEAGADAMLEAMKERLTFDYLKDEIMLDGEVFIPEEK